MSPRADLVAAGLRRWLAADEIVGPSGAVHAWYDAEAAERAFAYPEITGYALTHWAGQPDPTPEEILAARNASDWLITRVATGNLAARDGWETGGAYYFDLAMMANGLLLASDRLAYAEAQQAARQLVGLMLDEIERQGYLPALPGGQQTARTGWSVTGRAHMGKALQCLLHAAGPEGAHTGRTAEAVALVAQQTLDAQQPDGRFRTDDEDAVTMLHPHLYAVEGLWCHAQATGDATTADAARAGAKWVWQHQLPTGGLPRHVSTSGADLGPEQLDLTAQAVRAARLTGVESAAADRAADRLASLAVLRADGQMALPYQPEAAGQHLNAWVSMFARQALSGTVTSCELPWRALV